MERDDVRQTFRRCGKRLTCAVETRGEGGWEFDWGYRPIRCPGLLLTGLFVTRLRVGTSIRPDPQARQLSFLRSIGEPIY